MRPDRLAIMMLIPLLAACGSGDGGGKVQTTPRPVSKMTTPAKPVRQAMRYKPRNAPAALALPGLEGVIGSTAADLTRQFGTARLDVWEGDARKLQFIGNACVLDVYLYPAATGREPQASYLEARRSDGQDVDRAACISALRSPKP